MSTTVENQFTEYVFTDEELISAGTFSQLQRLYIQSEKARIALNLLNIEFAPEQPLEFVRQQAFLRGQLAFADFILDHDIAEEAKKRWDEIQEKRRNSIDKN